MAEFMISRLVQQLFTNQLRKLGRSVMEEVEKLSFKLAQVQTALTIADQIQFSDVSVKQWVHKVEDFCYEADSMFEEFKSIAENHKAGDQSTTNTDCSSKKLISLSCIPSSTSSITINKITTACKIIELNKKLDVIISEQKTLAFERSSSTEREPEMTTSVRRYRRIKVRGREKETLALMKELFMEEKRLRIIPIVGMGGIGKTTLAKFVYDHSEVKTYFDLRIWVHVGDSFDITVIAKDIIYGIKGICPNLTELESLLNCVKTLVQGKRFLLVLDNVWNEDRSKWVALEGSLNNGAQGSKVMVTTGNKKVAVMMKATTHMIFLDRLSNESCWYITRSLAFSEGLPVHQFQQLKEIGKKIVKNNCKGVPLIAKAYGNLLRSKSSEEEWYGVLKTQLWELSDVRQSVVDTLLSCYYDLSPLEKCCLLYCSILPADFEIDKDDLIQLWMSQGYLGSDKKSFQRGENCFKSLVMRSIMFQKIETNNFHGNFTKWKMNDVIHGFVRFATRSSKTLKFRTIYATGSDELSNLVNHDSLSKLSSNLRTLSLIGCDLQKLQRGTEKLTRLRYLNLSNNLWLKELPNQLCSLQNLQTLRLNGCVKLRRLPERMEELVNLQHLYLRGCDQLEELPIEIERLTSLETLDLFVVPSSSNGFNKNSKAMKLGDLSKLKQCRGNLQIRDIGNEEDAVEANKAKIVSLQNLVGLELNFCRRNNDSQRKHHVSLALLEALQPPPWLHSLEIREYVGATFPNWLVCLENLTRLVLKDCHECKKLPPCGMLPSLRVLHVEAMGNLETVGPEFFGTSEDEENFSESFPKLKELCFRDLAKWEKWSDFNYTSLLSMSDFSISYSDPESSYTPTPSPKFKYKTTIMPSLVSLKISNCHKLATLPNFIGTKGVLTIHNCPILEQRLQKPEEGMDWVTISDIPNNQGLEKRLAAPN
uniref:Uncharacterized protein n=1 Tax=Cannabis sativa TaxID=3483 RepID=A0A803Q764_CANSA